MASTNFLLVFVTNWKVETITDQNHSADNSCKCLIVLLLEYQNIHNKITTFLHTVVLNAGCIACHAAEKENNLQLRQGRESISKRNLQDWISSYKLAERSNHEDNIKKCLRSQRGNPVSEFSFGTAPARHRLFLAILVLLYYGFGEAISVCLKSIGFGS